MSGDVQVGLEVDGTRATVVTMQAGTVADIRTLAAVTAEKAVEQALAAVPGDAPVRAALVAEGLVVRRVDVTAADLTQARFADLAYAATGAPREGTTVAALLSDVTGVKAGLLGSGLAAVAPADPVTRLYKALTGRSAEVVAPAFTAHALEGVSLALRHTSADLTLVVDGHPVAHQQLRAGGLDVVEAVLGGGTDAGRARLETVLSGQAADQIAAGALERYLREVLTDTRDTLDAWARRGERVSRELYVYGPGARARSLDVLISDAYLTRTDQRDVGLALVHLPPAERAVAVAAYLAAASCGQNLPHAAFVSPARVRALETAARRARARRRVRTFALAAALLIVGLAGPAGIGVALDQKAGRDLDAARSELAAAAPDGHPVTDLGAREDLYSELAVTGDWAHVLPRAVDAAPADVRVDRVTVQRRGDDLVVDVAGTAESPDLSATNGYIERLQDRLAAVDVVPTSVSSAANGSGFTVTFTVPGGVR